MIHYITGGERSGKSGYAQRLALWLSNEPFYLATAKRWEDDFEQRVKRHIADRDDRWTTIEEEKYIGNLDLDDKVVVNNWVTLWLTNWLIEEKNKVEKCLESCKRELDRFFNYKAELIIISNEIGMGVHAQTEIGRKFTELQGWINQFIAKRADRAVFMVSGLPMKLK